MNKGPLTQATNRLKQDGGSGRSKAATREGKQAATYYHNPDVLKRFKRIAFEMEVSQQSLVDEAFMYIITKYEGG